MKKSSKATKPKTKNTKATSKTPKLMTPTLGALYPSKYKDKYMPVRRG